MFGFVHVHPSSDDYALKVLKKTYEGKIWFDILSSGQALIVDVEMPCGACAYNTFISISYFHMLPGFE